MSDPIQPASDEEIDFHFNSPGGSFCQSNCEDNPDCHGWGCELVSRLIARIEADRATIAELEAALAGVLEAGATFSGGRWDAARAALSKEPKE